MEGTLMGDDMDLNAIRMFICAVQMGSLSKAAEKLQLPLSTLSRNISELEKNLRIQLLERAKTGVTPTVAGQKFYEQTYLNMEAILEAERNLHHDEQQLSGLLRITTPPSYFPAWKIIRDFQQRYPNIQIQCTASERITDFFADGVDVAFRFYRESDDRVIAKKLTEVGQMLVATPAFLAKFGTPNSLEELQHFPLAGYGENGRLRLEKMFLQQNIELPAYFVSNDFQAILEYALHDCAIGFLPPYCVEQYLTSGQLVEILPNEPKYQHQMYLVYPSHKHPSAVLKAFVKFCLADNECGK
ncbi:LysR family transcriptional regulator [Actinobacillus equuli subsp. haemolyticus]|nr:LysR family transcriptional regulator [Actinobacillus equuli subsp. haemolyticus]